MVMQIGLCLWMRGNFISPDLIIALLGHYFLENKNYEGARPLVLQDIRSSKSVAEYLEPMGAELLPGRWVGICCSQTA